MTELIEMHDLGKLAMPAIDLRQRSESFETAVLGEQHILAVFPTNPTDLARHRTFQGADHQRSWIC